MPYENQRATGEALISLEQSDVFSDFLGKVHEVQQSNIPPLSPTQVPDSDEKIDRVLAIDGSLVTELVQNGYPGAEASLVQLALVFIDLRKLRDTPPDQIPSPRIFNEMDSATTLQAVLPGRNIASKSGHTPRDFFRETIFETLQGKVVELGHETLLETYEDLISGVDGQFRCPYLDSCNAKVEQGRGRYECGCSQSREVLSTDQLRFHERFNEVGPNGEAHGEVMRFLELVLLINVLRYFIGNASALRVLPKIAFVMDGPLAAFGQYAKIAPRIRDELLRISAVCREETGKDLLLISLSKTGQFVEHFERLDFCEEKGPDKRFAERTALLPDIKYIHRAIIFRSEDAKPWGKDTYFGRMVLYKSATGQRMVLSTAMTSVESMDLDNTSLASYPRLADSLKVVDELSTYLFEGGFVPIVRAHSHAAIPLKLGGEILSSLFDD